MFKGQYDEHMSVHTKDNRYICRKKGCRKDYGSTRAQNYHERQHSAKAVYCSFQENPKGKNVTNSFSVNNIWINIIKEPMERGGILSVASISVGPLNVPCTKKLVQNVRKLRNNRLSRNGKRSSNFFRILFTCFLCFPRGH